MNKNDERFTADCGDDVRIVEGFTSMSPDHAIVYNYTRHATMCMSRRELYGRDADGEDN